MDFANCFTINSCECLEYIMWIYGFFQFPNGNEQKVFFLNLIHFESLLKHYNAVAIHVVFNLAKRTVRHCEARYN